MSGAEQQALELARGTLGSEPVWLVGGVIRDRLRGLERTGGVVDLDLIIDGDSERAARDLRAAAPAGAAVGAAAAGTFVGSAGLAAVVGAAAGLASSAPKRSARSR